jgi:hypothetical protein
MRSLDEIVAANNRQRGDEGWEMASRPTLHGETVKKAVSTEILVQIVLPNSTKVVVSEQIFG